MKSYQDKAQLIRLLSHPVRLQILDEVRKRASCVCHLQAVTHRPQAYVSQQLRILREAGVVVDEKDGQNVFYYLRNGMTLALLDTILGPVDVPHHIPGCTCPYCLGEQE